MPKLTFRSVLSILISARNLYKLKSLKRVSQALELTSTKTFWPASTKKKSVTSFP